MVVLVVLCYVACPEPKLFVNILKTENYNEVYVMSKIEMTNMCMIVNKENNKIVVQERVKSWKGLSFPGGHIENGESIVESTIREIREETGLEISNLVSCGVIHWHNTDTDDKYLVFNFKTECYSGDLFTETDEGKVFWMDIDDMQSQNLSRGLSERLPMFLENKYSEGFGTWNSQGYGVLSFL